MLLMDKVKTNLAKYTNAPAKWSRGKRIVNESTIKEKYETLHKLQEVEDSHNIEEIITMHKDIDNMLEEKDLK